MAQPLPIAGWYPDPELSEHDRWWDGAGWTDTRRVSSDALTSPTGSSPSAAYAAAPAAPNNLALIGFILSLSGLLLPIVVNSIAGGIVSVLGLRRSTTMAGSGIVSTGRRFSIAGILIGFIWGGLCLLFVALWIVFWVWVWNISQVPPSLSTSITHA